MSTKRKQYVIRQFSISDIADKDGTFSMSGEGAPVKQSENFLFHMIEKKWSPDSEALKNVISIKAGRNAKKGEKEVLAHILNDGVTLGEKTLIPSIVDAVILIVNTLINNMDKVLAAAMKIIEGLARGLINALPKLIDALPKIITSLIDFITNNIPLIIELGIKLTVQLAVGLIKAIPQLIAKLPEIIAAIVKGLGAGFGDIVKVGAYIIQGVWEGIQSMAKWIWDKVNGFFSGIVDNVKGLLGIHSPSTVFAGIGGNMAQGLGLGFGSAMDKVSSDMQNAIPTNFDLNTSVNVGATSRSSGGGLLGGGSGFMLHIENFVNNTEKDIQQLAYEFEFYRQQAAMARGNA